MKFYLLWCCLGVFLVTGCDQREREEALQKREAALHEKEQQLLLKEKRLDLQAEELTKRQQALDSTIVADTLAKVNPSLIGFWNVQMTCTETTCQGSAVGDTKTETWEISYQGKNVIAKAKVNDELVRVYSGIFSGNTLELAETANPSVQPTTNILVRLQLTSDTKLDGQREIERLNESCKIIYAMAMEKK